MMRGPVAALLFASVLFGGPHGAAAAPVDVGAIRGIALSQFDQHELQSLLLEIRVNGIPVLTEAFGEAMTGVAATPEARFRNGAVGLTYVAALMLRLAEEGALDLDEPIARWLPDLPGADLATPRMLANMTAGYPDHVANETEFLEPFNDNPFTHWTPQELIRVSLSTPRRFAPGTNWDYSHSDYVILGQVLEQATGRPLHALLQDHLLGPFGLHGTASFDTAEIPGPVIHGFTAERGVWEDATFWNPSWTMPSGAIQITTISDMARSFDAIVGHDGFLTSQSRTQMIAPALIGFGTP